MRTKGLVMNNQDNKSEILVYRAEACGSCASCAGCGQQSSPSTVWIENRLNAKPGQTVTLEMDDSGFVSGTIRMYAVPLILFFIGIFGTNAILNAMGNSNEIITLLGGLVLMLAYLFFGKFLDRRATQDLSVEMIHIDDDFQKNSETSCQVK